MSQEFATKDHVEIIAWMERRNGYAAVVSGTHPDAAESFEPEVGALRIGFPGYASEEALDPISWDEFLEAFKEADATFYYIKTEPNGTMSHRYRIEA